MRPKGSALFSILAVTSIVLTLTSAIATSHADSTPSPSPSTSASVAPSSASPTSASPNATSSDFPNPSSAPSPNTGSAGQPRKILTGWIPYYSMKTSLPSAILNADLVQQVSPFWYSLKDQKTIADLYTPANPNVPMAVPLQSMRSAGFKIIPTITDGTDVDPKTGKISQMVLSNLLADPISRQNVVNTIVNLVTANNFDGIDLDFENFAYVDPISTWSTTQARWVQFITDLSTALHSQSKILSITTPPLFDPVSGKKGYYLYAWAQVAGLIDQLHIMAYDYSTKSPGPIGPLQWTTDAVNYAVSVVPASKIYIGIPGYGRDWVTKVIGTCPTLPINYNKTVSPGVVSTVVMHNVAALAAAYGATPIYNQTFAENSFTYQKTYNGTLTSGALTTCTAYRTVWFQDARSFTARANLVSKYHLGGLSEWTFGMEDPTAFQAIRVVALSIAPDSVTASIKADSTQITIGTPTKVVGTFTLPDKTPAAGIPVHLQTQVSGGQWVTAEDGITGADGSYSATLQLTQSSNIRMYTDSSWQRLEGDTPTLTINVSRSLTWTIPASMKTAVAYQISAQVAPAVAGVSVKLSDGTTSVTDANGSAIFTITNSTTGFTPYQLSIAADTSFAAVQTGFVTVWVR